MGVVAPISRWKWILLMTELVLFAVILILPQVDLPDFTFHGGSAPVVAKARVYHVPAVDVVGAHSRALLLGPRVAAVREFADALPSKEQDVRLSLLCTLIC